MMRTVPQAVFDSPEARRIQHEATRQATAELDRTPRRLLSEGNPNHPCHDQLFGYDRDVFLAKQYRKART